MPESPSTRDNASAPDGQGLSLPRRLLRLCLAVGGLLLIMHVIAPFLVNSIKPFRKYADTVEETGIIPGALYYTDIPQSVDAEVNNRDAIRYFTGKPKKEEKKPD